MSTSTIERVEDVTVLQEGDPRYSHIVYPKQILADAIINGQAVKALCGHVFVPGRDPGKYPVCSLCVAAYEEIHGEINDDVDGMGGR